MRYIYYTNHKEDKQRTGIKDYLTFRGIFWGDCTTLFSDFKYDDPNYDVGIKNMLTSLAEGDIVYVWDLSVLARNLDSLYALLLSASQMGISFVQCLDGEVISSESAESLAFIKGVGLASRIIFESKSLSSKRGLDEKRRLIEEQGGFYNKNGEWMTRLGPPIGRTFSESSRAAMGAGHRRRKEEWRATSVGYTWVVSQLKAGIPRRQILAEFNRRHVTNPEDYSTRTGGPLCEGTLSRWAHELDDQE